MSDQRFLEQTVAMARAGEYARAIPRFARLIQSYPENVPLRLLWAKSLALNFQLTEAEIVFEHIVQGTFSDSAVMMEVAKCREEVDHYEVALNLWREVTDKGDRHAAQAWVEVARLSERLNLLGEAQDAIARAEHLGEGSPRCVYVRALLDERLESYSSALEGYQKVASKAQNLELRQLAWHRLSKIYEYQGDIRSAVEAVFKAKSLDHLNAIEMRKASPVFNPEKFTACEQNPENVSNKHVMMLGFPRSGTTLVSRRIASHSQVVLMDESLVASHILNKYKAHKGKISQFRAKEAAAEYWGCVRNLSSEVLDTRGVLVDKNPAMSLWTPWLRAVFPHAKMIWVDRDPRDIFVSCFFTYFPLNGLTSYFRDPDSLISVIETAWRHRLYLMRECSPDNVRCISYEALIDHGGELDTKIWSYLGLTPPEKGETYQQKGELINSPTYADSIKPVYVTSVARWEKYEHHFPRLFERLVSLCD